ncbi:MAG: hypothetical protein KA444_08000 [Bacteroidia bacterium]|nr:hypothetical protein [Bacteroidia bacterium]
MKFRIRTLFLFILYLLLGTILLLIISGGGFGEKESPVIFSEKKVNYIAHRGALHYFAENSSEGFDYCHDLGFNAIEADIRVTKDNSLIVFHDDSTKRLLGSDHLISDLDLIDIRSEFLHFNGIKTKNKILSIDELLEKYQNQFVLYLDNKVNKKWVADKLIDHIQKAEATNTTIIASSNLLFLSYIEFKNESINTALEGFDAGKEWIYYFIPRNFKPDFYSSFMSNVDTEHIDFLRRNNIIDQKIVYGTDSSNVKKVLQSGIRNLIIDFDSSFIDLIKPDSIK